MGKSVAPYRPDMRGQGIDFEILPRHPHRVGVIVAGKNMSAPRLGKRNCEYAGARADIGDLGRAAFFQHMRQQVQTPLGCLMMARTEGKPGIHFNMVARAPRMWPVVMPEQKKRRHLHGRQILLAS